MENSMIEIKTPFYDGQLKLVKKQYANNGRVHLSLVDPNDDDAPWFTATANLPDETLEDGYVFLKCHSENEGLPEALVKAGVVNLTGRIVNSGYVTVQEAKLLV